MILNIACGGGPRLNIKVVGGTTQPENMTENMIWVNTDTEITGWIFSPSAPENPVDGMVWITYGTSSTLELNVLKKDGVVIYPGTCYQYVNGSWIDKDVSVCQNGQLVGLALYLYENGTIGKIAGEVVRSDDKNNFVLNSDHIHINSTGHNTWGYIYFKNPINLTPYKTLNFRGSMSIYGEGESWGFIRFGVFKNIGLDAVAKLDGPKVQGTHSLDISNIGGEHYIGFYLKGFANYAMADVYEVYLK